MKQQRYYYLVKIQYLGYRLHGWQRQPGLKTVEGLVKKTLKFVLGDLRFKILGSSRTDAMVSAHESAFELFTDHEPLENLADFLVLFNKNLPPDIRALSIKEVDAGFNIIQHPKKKEYLYLFSFGRKSHPFAAPLMATFPEKLEVDLMMQGAKLFEGKHSFHNYCTKPTPHTVLQREIVLCEIVPNKEITASFFPDKSFLLRVTGSGFLRNQIRLMMGCLVQLGRGEYTIEEVQKSLDPDVKMPMTYIAPGSGLILNKVEFDQ
ncbi:tRNA pseudouridine38-40 synthase [Salinimicrobium sediminis]|uniref:tRNA pseudouridine synthase A n=1 Tax=Salinimicrobium sediminis TaxID=1343891 RepID=A0A285X4D7_9FLAO|nr:tRNA pseudouridine(38-40) synthase TruA [Salinimicrobium sediminis]SOC80182.1 tRNA pseudouridine38-40 synthase [Salinimicrobium sediminis]